MKKTILSIFALLMLVGFLASCETPTCTHVDKDDDLLCDLCGVAHDDGPEKPQEAEYEIKITSVNEPAFISTWKLNKGEQVNKQTEFAVLDAAYQVGDDNAFNCKPLVTFIKVNKETGATLPAGVSDWNYEIQVLVKEGEEFVALAETNEYIEKIDSQKCAIDFSEAAIGKEFQVVVKPEGLTEEQEASGHYQTSFEFTVIEGFNAYSALDLAYIENRPNPVDGNGEEGTDLEREAWLKFKEEKGIDLEYKPAAVILHNDIKVTKADVPSYYFWTAEEVSKLDADYNRVVGSMRDRMDFYRRHLEEGEEFKLLGNYFKIDNSELPVIVRENDKVTPEGTVISHTALFKFSGAGDANVEFAHLRIVGNAGRTENAILSGGQILIKVTGPQMLAYNNISVNTFIHYFAEHNEDSKTADNTTVFTVEKCKGYNAFNSFLYNWGSHMIVKDSELIGAGGPIVIQDHCNSSKDNHPGYIPEVEFINSKVESFVAGSEGWFKIVQADSLVPGIKQLSQIFNMVGKTFVVPNDETDPAKQATFLNLISVTKGPHQTFTQIKIEGKVVKEGHTFDYGVTAGQNGNPYIRAVLDQTFALNAPAFETNAGGFAYFDGTGLVGLDQQYIQDPTNPIFAGDTLTIYYMGMMLTFGYYNVGYVH